MKEGSSGGCRGRGLLPGPGGGRDGRCDQDEDREDRRDCPWESGLVLRSSRVPPLVICDISTITREAVLPF